MRLAAEISQERLGSVSGGQLLASTHPAQSRGGYHFGSRSRQRQHALSAAYKAVNRCRNVISPLGTEQPVARHGSAG
jgi:hypothetical protein